jgi:gas vesicle protein
MLTDNFAKNFFGKKQQPSGTEQKLHKVVDTGATSLHKFVSTAADTSKTAVNTSLQNAQSVKEMAKESGQSVGGLVAESAESIKEIAQENAESVKENVQSIKEMVQENAESIKETAQEVLSYTQQAAQTIGEKIGIFDHKEEESEDFGASSLQGVLGAVADTSKATVQKTQENVGNIQEFVSDNASEVKKYCCSEYGEY